MTTTLVDIGKTPAQLSELLSLVLSGTEIVIAQRDKVLARLIPVIQSESRVGNLNPHSISTNDDFDAPLPDEFWLGDQ